MSSNQDSTVREVFVYGTLMHGFGNHNHFLQGAEVWGPAVTLHPIYDLVCLGGFPGVLAGGECAVDGELYTVDEDTMKRLDRLESNGHMYQREIVPVAIQGGSIVDAWMYVFMGEPWQTSYKTVDLFQTEAGFFVQKWTGPSHNKW